MRVMRRAAPNGLVTSSKFHRGMAIGVTSVALALTGAALSVTVDASASNMVAGEGSVQDTQNLTATAASDATASTGELSGIALRGANSSGCGGEFTRPAERANTASSTNAEIFSRLTLQCYGYNDVDLYQQIQRSRWYGWQGLASVHISNNSSYNYRWNKDLTTSCRAGTWSYRAIVSGSINGQGGGETHTGSFRTTCANSNDLTFVDLS